MNGSKMKQLRMDSMSNFQKGRVARERADALAQLQTPGAMEDHALRPVTELPLDLPSLLTRLREEGSQLEDESVTHANNTAIVADLDAETTAGAVELGPSQQDTGRYTADLSDPEQAQREAIERQKEENLLFDTHKLEETADQEMGEVPGRPTARVAVAPHSSNPVSTDRDHERGGLYHEVEGPASLAPGTIQEGLSSDAPPERRVTETFHVYEQGEWRKMDMVFVSPHHLAEAQIIADRCARDPNQNARFYDGRLRKVAVDECVRAAIDDGTFAVLMGFGRDLVVTRHLVASVAQLFGTVGSDGEDYALELGQAQAGAGFEYEVYASMPN
ncbi:hypothetical protein BDW69DRAFT_183210 [Aspergillus filifer]